MYRRSGPTGQSVWAFHQANKPGFDSLNLPGHFSSVNEWVNVLGPLATEEPMTPPQSFGLAWVTVVDRFS